MESVSGSIDAVAARALDVHFGVLSENSKIESTGGSATATLSAPMRCKLDVRAPSVAVHAGNGGIYDGTLTGGASQGTLDASAVEGSELDDAQTGEPDASSPSQPEQQQQQQQQQVDSGLFKLSRRGSGKISDEGRRLMGLPKFGSGDGDRDGPLPTLKVISRRATATVKVMTWIDKIRKDLAKKRQAKAAAAAAAAAKPAQE